jgi:hypothetical protein
MKVKTIPFAIGVFFTTLNAAGPQIDFSGYLDADVWADLKGKYYVNSELDLGMSLKFNDKVSSHVYATVNSANNAGEPGRVPAGIGNPSDRWLDIKFDGFDITFSSSFGTFSVGDLVYQYGKFNYYYYKRLSMITPEGFTRGIRYSIGNNLITQEVTAGISDLGETITDVQGATNLTLTEKHLFNLSYGFQNNSMLNFSTGSKVFAGIEYLGEFGEILSLKTDFGYINLPGEERKNVFTLLVEPLFKFGKFTTAMAAYAMFDPDSANTDLTASPLLGISDEFFYYMEPGFSFTDKFSVGLPLEIHGMDLENKDDNAFWAVPTFYIYPTENVQWWLWGQVVVPMIEKSKRDGLLYGIGSEIIVNF